MKRGFWQKYREFCSRNKHCLMWYRRISGRSCLIFNYIFTFKSHRKNCLSFCNSLSCDTEYHWLDIFCISHIATFFFNCTCNYTIIIFCAASFYNGSKFLNSFKSYLFHCSTNLCVFLRIPAILKIQFYFICINFFYAVDICYIIGSKLTYPVFTFDRIVSLYKILFYVKTFCKNNSVKTEEFKIP